MTHSHSKVTLFIQPVSLAHSWAVAVQRKGSLSLSLDPASQEKAKKDVSVLRWDSVPPSPPSAGVAPSRFVCLVVSAEIQFYQKAPPLEGLGGG